MGTLIQHGKGDGAIWTYQPIGGDKAYRDAPTSALLLLAVQATRLVWRAPHAGVAAAQRFLLDIARGRGVLEPLEVIGKLADALPQKPKDDDGSGDFSFSIKFTLSGAAIEPDEAADIVQSMVYLGWDHLERFENAPLGDSMSRSVTRLLGKIAFLLREDDAGLERLRDLEIRCLVHSWTNTLEVIPRALIASLIEAGGLNKAKALAVAWRQGPAREPFPTWTPPPPTEADLLREEARRLAGIAEEARRAALTPAEREAEDADARHRRIILQGLIMRDVQ